MLRGGSSRACREHPDLKGPSGRNDGVTNASPSPIDWESELCRIDSQTHDENGRPARAATEEEWCLIQRAVSEAGFVATIKSISFGFSFALCVYAPYEPIFPGIPSEPRLVLTLAAKQFPGNDPHGTSQPTHTSTERDGGVFDVFRDLAHSPKNLAACEREGVDPPRYRGWYSY